MVLLTGSWSTNMYHPFLSNDTTSVMTLFNFQVNLSYYMGLEQLRSTHTGHLYTLGVIPPDRVSGAMRPGSSGTHTHTLTHIPPTNPSHCYISLRHNSPSPHLSQTPQINETISLKIGKKNKRRKGGIKYPQITRGLDLGRPRTSCL